MTADPFMERVQARVVDLAEQSWRDARLAETEAAAPPKWADLWAIDRDYPLPDFTIRTDANGDEWTDTFGYESDAGRWFDPSEWLAPTPPPTPGEYADAERLLRSRGPLDADAARLRCWITDTRPLAVKAGWNDDEDLDLDATTPQADYDSGRWCGECEWAVVADPPCCFTRPLDPVDDGRDYTTITDRLVLADLASRAPRPSLWTRISEKWIAAGVVVLFILLLLTPWLAA